MARKFEFRLKTWLPHIAVCYVEYEELDTISIVKSIGRILVKLGSAAEQLAEIQSVLDYLVKIEMLVPKISKSSKSYYWGINFENILYLPAPGFIDLVDQMQKSSKPQSDSTNVNIQTTQKVYNFNLTFALEKLFEINTKFGLLNL